MRRNTCKCLLFEEQQSLGNPLSSLTSLNVCVCVVHYGAESLQECFHLFCSVWIGGNYNFSGGIP